MNRQKGLVLGAVMVAAAIAASPVPAQTIQSYRCADGTRFIVGFFDYDTRAHLQIDGGPVTLRRRPSLSGSRYAGGGVTLKIARTGTTVRHLGRLSVACEAN
jgi:membrane-bound inhibitor of C-type lysozyme